MLKNLQIDQNRVARIEELRKQGINPFPYTFHQTHHAKNINDKYAPLKEHEHTKDVVSVAGRVMLKRVMGGASFYHVQDQTGRVQIYAREDGMGAEKYELFTKKIDMGDIIGVEGIVFKTKKGEVTVEVKKFELLCKSLLTLPEKYHGLKDEELRYRQRYVDLFVNPDIKSIFFKRSEMIKVVRNYFIEKGFLDVEIPTLQTMYGGANARPFITHINTWNMKMYLSISPELYLKRLLVGGFEKVFTICKNFRNEDVDHTHNPEFTMLEVYQTYVDYNTMMTYMEEVYERSCIAMNGSTKVKQKYDGQEVILDFKAPWKRMTMLDAMKQFAKIDASKMDVKQIKETLEKHHIDWEGQLTWGIGVTRLFEELVEDKLIQPIHITDHPFESTPLCKRHRKDPRLIERFESFCLGMELSNAYSELNDPILQRKLLEDQHKELVAGAEEAHPLDEDFLQAIEYGMPPAGGLGFGIDRMAVILTGVDAIRDVILFPTVKPLHDSKQGETTPTTQPSKSKETMLAVAIINKSAKLQKWQELSTIAHLNAAFGARVGKQLLYQDTIATKDDQTIKLNIQHAIMIKEVSSAKQLQELAQQAHDKKLEVAEFTREMLETTNDKKIITQTKEKNLKDVEHLGVLLFGKKADIDGLTKSLKLYS